MSRGAVIAQGYWCPVCRFAFRAHTPDELGVCADKAETQRRKKGR